MDIDPVKRPGGCRRLIVPLLFVVAAGLVAVRFLVPLKRPILPRAVEVSDVQSAIEQEGDSLRVVVNWRMVQPRGPELAESTRVEVGISDGAKSQVATVPANEQSDTLHVPAPAPGQTATGYSCVAAMTRGRLAPENCTPWQFVRPAAGQSPADSAPAPGGKPRAGATPKVSRIVVQPEGIQVDPDVGARCAAWQRQHPGTLGVDHGEQPGDPGVHRPQRQAHRGPVLRLRRAGRRPAGQDHQLAEGGVLRRALPPLDRGTHRLISSLSVTLSVAKGAMLEHGPLRCAQGDSRTH